MSIENVRKFFHAAKSDSKLSDSIKAINAPSFSAAAAEIVRIASDAGHSFTEADYEATVRQDLDKKWWRYSQMTPEQEKALGISAATQPLGADTASDMVISECIDCPTRIYTPCGC